ncbi:hypothetical protein Leryth_018535 [Lithospermum erythrorhizon]|nr:hypothetical protein Leryth_018535 [Lithospermum erythrorhizon]
MVITLSRRNTDLANCIYTYLASHFSSQHRAIIPKPLKVRNLCNTFPLHQCLQSDVQIGKYGVTSRFLHTSTSGTNLDSSSFVDAIETKLDSISYPKVSELSSESDSENLGSSAPEGSTIFSEEICFSWIAKLCRSGKVIAAMEVVQSLRGKGIHVSIRTYNFLLKMAVEQKNIDIVSQSFKELLTFPESVGSSSFTLLAKAFSVINDDARLLIFIREISDLTFPRNVSVVNKIILAFADCGQVDNSLMIFGQMRNFNCEPNLITYNIIIGVLGHHGQIDEMLHLFTSMQEAHISPDIVTFNTIVNSLRKVGRLQLILVYFKQMIQLGVQPDLRTYTALIDSFGRSGNVEESLRLLEEMKCRRICPSIYIYRSLIHNSKKSEKLETAMKLLEEMNSSISSLVGPEDFKKRDR